MRKEILPTLLLISSLAALGHTGSKTDPIPLEKGNITVDFGTQSSVFYTYTPEHDSMLTFSNLSNVNIYTAQVEPAADRYGDTFNQVTYVQTKGGVQYTIEVGKGWQNATPSSFDFDSYDCAWPAGESFDTPIRPFDKLCYMPVTLNLPTHLVYTPASDGVLSMFFTAFSSVEYSTTKDGDFSTVSPKYVTGGGYSANIEVTEGQTYYFKVTAYGSMMCRFELLQPVTGTSPDFPYEIDSDTPAVFPKEKGSYYYKIANNGSDGYLIIQGDEPFSGEAAAGMSFTSLYGGSSTDRIHIRMSASSYYQEYYLRLTRNTEATADQTFTATYSTEPYDIFPGQTIESGEHSTSDFDGLYYYTFTVPEDGRNIINIKAVSNVTDETTKASLYYSDNQYSALASGKEIRYEAVAGRQYTVSWRVGAADAPLTFSLGFAAPALGESPSNPIIAVPGENSNPGGVKLYFKYEATMDGWLYITPADGLGMPAVSMLPIPSDPYMQACEVIADGSAYRVATTKERGYLITFNTEGEITFKLAEQPALTGEATSVPFDTTDGIADLPETVGTYWYRYTSPRDGKLEISTNIRYEISENRQDYTFVRIYSPSDPDNFISELRPDLDNGTFVNRVIDTKQGTEYLVKVRTLESMPGIWVKMVVRDPIEGEVPEKPILIPFNGNSGSYEFDRMVNSPEYGIWYAIDLPEGVFNMSGSSAGSFEMNMYASGNTETPVAKAEQIGMDYDEEEEMFIYIWGIKDFYIENAGRYLMHVVDNAIPFEMSFTMGTSGVSDIPSKSAHITAKDGGISITASGIPFEIYTLSGLRIFRGTIDGTIHVPLSPATYIVRSGDYNTKLIVK